MTCTAVIVQARLGSTRLPGKVLKKLAKKTVLAHVLERCQAIEGADMVCCATTKLAADDPVAAEAERCGATVFRGSEADVLNRYWRATQAISAEIVMRITSDCPLIDPEICARVLRLRAQTDADYACNNMPPSWPHGLDCEAFTFAWLERAARQAVKPSEREHVTPFIRNHPEARKMNLEGPGGEAVHHRWTLDTETDFQFLEALFARLPAGPQGRDWRGPLAIIEADPALAAMSARQNRYDGLKRSLAADAAKGLASEHG